MHRRHGHPQFLVALSLALGALGVFVYGVFFVRAAIVDVATLEYEVKQTSERRGARGEFVRAAEETAPERALVDAYFIAPDDVVAFIQEIEALASTTGAALTVESVDIEAGGGAGRTETLDLSLRAQGTWVGVFHVVTLLETMPRPLAVESVRFSKGAEEQWTLSVVLSAVKLR